MNSHQRIILVRAFSKQYQKSTKRQRGITLDQLEKTTGYSRKHLGRLLLSPPKRKKFSRVRPSPYRVILKPLEKLWAVSNYACGKRLVPMIPVYLEALVRFGEIKVSQCEKKLLLSVSVATADRLLTHERRKINLKGRPRTKPGTLLKHQIPIRTWAEWSDTKPGFLEIDSVHHCGASLHGEYAYTLDTTDVATGWNECAAHLGRGEQRTIGAMEEIERRLPFPLKGINFDSGGEFVNWHFVRWSQRKQITYSRSRETIKNDQAYVEQQNYSVVRRFVGYGRIDQPEQIKLLNQLYRELSDYQNFFQPVMKLKEKVRDGARVTRKYDLAKTAYQRVLERDEIPSQTKEKLIQRFKSLNPRKLLKEITKLAEKTSQCR